MPLKPVHHGEDYDNNEEEKRANQKEPRQLLTIYSACISDYIPHEADSFNEIFPMGTGTFDASLSLQLIV